VLLAAGRGTGTWSQRDRDDAVVNCNVLHALATLGVPGTATEIAAVQRLVQQSVGGCRYYCSSATIGYAARRAGLPLGALPAGLVARPRPGNEVLRSAQWLSTVRRWDMDLIAGLLAAQSQDGRRKPGSRRRANPSRSGVAEPSAPPCPSKRLILRWRTVRAGSPKETHLGENCEEKPGNA
jgi:hypothetical protein